MSKLNLTGFNGLFSRKRNSCTGRDMTASSLRSRHLIRIRHVSNVVLMPSLNRNDDFI